jgi:PIN domain nuclease of toxin-antitoxin system
LRLLLDTHAALWWLRNDGDLGEAAIDELADESNDVLLSAVVVWEIAVKRALGKLEASEDVIQMIRSYDVRGLPITLAHAAEVERLPPHHRDPFDRMLVAQAMLEGAAIVSRDEKLRPYDVEIIW